MSAQPEYVPDDPTAFESACAFIETTVADLSPIVPDMVDEADGATCAAVLLRLRELRIALDSLEKYAEAKAAQAFGKGKHAIPGFQVEVKGGSRWTDWRHDDVAFALCRDIAVDPDTGELNPDVLPMIDAVRSRLLNAARPEWRLTVLRRYGLNVRDYAQWSESRRTVQIVPDTEATP